VPIPVTSHVRRLEENAAAAALSLSADTAEVLDRVFAPGAAAGLRYPESHLARLGPERGSCQVREGPGDRVGEPD